MHFFAQGRRTPVWLALLAALVSALVIATIMTSADPGTDAAGAGGDRLAQNASHVGKLGSCVESDDVDRCLGDLVRAALSGEHFVELGVELYESAELNDRCTQLVRQMSESDLALDRDPVDILVGSDTPACNGAVAERSMLFVGPRADRSTFERLAAACLERAPLSVPGKTTACAKGLGWGLAAAGSGIRSELAGCVDLVEAGAGRSGRDWVRDDLGRYSYGCAHGVVMAHHAPYADATMTIPVDDIVDACRSLADLEHRQALSVRSGCAGGLGTALGQRAAAPSDSSSDSSAASSASSYSSVLTAAVEQALGSCTQLFKGRPAPVDAPEWQCVHQVFRQNAWRLYPDRGTADQYCASLEATQPSGVVLRCEEEATRKLTS